MSDAVCHAEARGAGLQERAVPAGAHVGLRLGAAQPVGVGDGLVRELRVVGAGDREPVVVVGALRAVGRDLRAERGAQLQRRLELVLVEAHEGVAEAVHAAVALEARAGAVAGRDGLARIARVDVGRHAGDEPVREPGRTARVVVGGQVVHQRGERHPGVAGVGAPDGVHDDVAVLEQEAALAARRVVDAGDRRPRVLDAVDHRQELTRVAAARVVVGEVAAVLDLERAQLRRRLGLVPAQRDGERDAHREQAGGRHGEGERQAAVHPWYSATTFLGTHIAQASRTSSSISGRSIAARRTQAQL